jgi:protein dithiol oxidoreductase (disulfide-forming)
VKLIKQLFVLAALLFATHTFAATMNHDYKLVQPAQPTHSGNKVEVLEFFFYGCSHCYNLHPLLSEWEKKMPKDVTLEYVPTIFNPSWEPMANTYYALELMGKQKQLHDPLFKAWNVTNTDLGDLAKISAFVAKNGVDSKAFADNYQSFSVQTKVMRSKQMTQSYALRGTPTIVVDGKYLITGLQPADAIKVLNDLVEMARKERLSGKQ